ncbi:MAG: hypothetical protein AMXMBFR13_04840 [Phycisphaerae bacterium]
MSMTHRLRPARCCAAGFTLIEVLVVVAIIAVLLAILMPSLANAREKAKRTVCLSNQKQIANALGMYVHGQQGWLPHSVPAFNASLTWIVWQEFAKKPYPPKGWVHLGLLYGAKMVKEPQIFYCPSYRAYPHVYPEGWNRFEAGNKGIEKVATSYSYALNGQIDWYSPGVRTTARWEKVKINEALYACVFIGKVDKKQRYGVWPHRGGINAGYADGSARGVHVDDKLASEAFELYNDNSIPPMDYFSYCFYRMLAGDRKWIQAYPNLPVLP